MTPPLDMSLVAELVVTLAGVVFMFGKVLDAYLTLRQQTNGNGNGKTTARERELEKELLLKDKELLRKDLELLSRRIDDLERETAFRGKWIHWFRNSLETMRGCLAKHNIEFLFDKQPEKV